MEQLIMTEEEIRLLSAVYDNEARLREGKLYDYQKEALDQLRAGLAYLDSKYPDFDPEILTFTPATKFTHWAQFLIRGDGEGTYTLTVEPTGDDFLCQDTCYGKWIREPYDCYVTELLQSAGISAGVYTHFPVPVGMEIGQYTTVSEFIQFSPRINRQTRLYIADSGNAEADAATIRQLLKEAGLYGHYFLYCIPADQMSSVEEMEQNRKQWDSISFTCYDV